MTDPARSAEFERRLGAHLAAVRELAGFSQEALAVQLRRDQSYVSRIESAVRHPGLVYMLEIAEALNLQFADLATAAEEIWRDTSP